jgi:osmotically-inducible protein OsmY
MEKEIMISVLKPLPTWMLVALMGLLGGCATYDKCGLEGCPGDAKITAAVEALFSQHPDLGDRITVKTLDRTVYLEGFVNDGLERTTAESIARTASGVVRVVNNITVPH